MKAVTKKQLTRGGTTREVHAFIENCVFDISDPSASPKRKRRAKEWLCYWATELERMANEGRAHPYNRPRHASKKNANE